MLHPLQSSRSAPASAYGPQLPLRHIPRQVFPSCSPGRRISQSRLPRNLLRPHGVCQTLAAATRSYFPARGQGAKSAVPPRSSARCCDVKRWREGGCREHSASQACGSGWPKLLRRRIRLHVRPRCARDCTALSTTSARRRCAPRERLHGRRGAHRAKGGFNEARLLGPEDAGSPPSLPHQSAPPRLEESLGPTASLGVCVPCCPTFKYPRRSSCPRATRDRHASAAGSPSSTRGTTLAAPHRD